MGFAVFTPSDEPGSTATVDSVGIASARSARPSLFEVRQLQRGAERLNVLRIEHVVRFDHLGSCIRQAVLSSVQQESRTFAGELGGCADRHIRVPAVVDVADSETAAEPVAVHGEACEQARRVLGNQYALGFQSLGRAVVNVDLASGIGCVGRAVVRDHVAKAVPLTSATPKACTPHASKV
ncbi:hypothetical protein [Nonomuraea jabiensis]|uniref:hypothetical protein n=1 Tax=Nonomuraea jabiensis TaxID=882448 RepID=UPI003D71B950